MRYLLRPHSLGSHALERHFLRAHTLPVALALALAAASAAAGCAAEITEPPIVVVDCGAPGAPNGADPACGELTAPIHVTTGGADVGACTSAAPCRTLQYALRQVTPSRAGIRVDAERLVTAAPIAIDQPVTIDARGTAIDQPAGLPIFAISAHAGLVTLRGFALRGALVQVEPAVPVVPAAPSITVGRGTTLRLSRSVLDAAVIDLLSGTLELRDAKATTPLDRTEAVRCRDGSVHVRRVDFERAAIRAASCYLHVARARFDVAAGGSITASGGLAIIENNLIVEARAYAGTHATAVHLADVAPASTVRFNTFARTEGATSDGVALSCDGPLLVTSNIFAYGSAHPLGPPHARCAARFSLFDSAVAPEQLAGEGNRIAAPSTFFVDRTAGDYHLSDASPARSAAEPATGVAEDLEGNPRPLPLGSAPDIGAFEAP